jgi:hypothetical protein
MSRPELVYNTPSTLKVRSESLRFTMARVLAPAALIMSTVRLVSVVVPDWLMATTRVLAMAVSGLLLSVMQNPDSSEDFNARISMSLSPR